MLVYLNFCPLFLVDNQELTSGSESDMSLCSMIFPNNSSSSDDSLGEGDPSVGLDQSMVLLEPSELQAEDEHHHGNIWRLYFGSSYESEFGNSPISGLVRNLFGCFIYVNQHTHTLHLLLYNAPYQSHHRDYDANCLNWFVSVALVFYIVKFAMALDFF